MSVIEIIREADVEEEGDENMKQKFKERSDFVDKDARVSIKKIQMIASTIKCYYGCNHFGERDKIINNRAWSDEFLWYSEKEMWEHVEQFRNAASIRADFVLEFHKDLKKV